MIERSRDKWDTTLSAEREQRLAKLMAEQSAPMSARSVQAVRAAITRKMLRELKAETAGRKSK